MKLSEETTRELLAHALGLNKTNELPFFIHLPIDISLGLLKKPGAL